MLSFISKLRTSIKKFRVSFRVVVKVIKLATSRANCSETNSTGSQQIE